MKRGRISGRRFKRDDRKYVCASQAINEEELKVSQLLTLHPRRQDLEMVFFGSHLRVDSSVIKDAL